MSGLDDSRRVWVAGVEDAAAAAQLLHDFNEEYEDFTPGPELIAERLEELIPGDELRVVLAGDGPDGVAVLRLRPSFWREAVEGYLAELYVVPALRGTGLGRALMHQVMEIAKLEGADHIGICTSTDDVAACGLYESFGFTNREGGGDGPLMIFYELEL